MAEKEKALDGASTEELVQALSVRGELKTALPNIRDDDLLLELTKRNPMLIYSAARGIEGDGKPFMPTMAVHGGDMHVHALLSRLQMYIFTKKSRD